MIEFIVYFIGKSTRFDENSPEQRGDFRTLLTEKLFFVLDIFLTVHQHVERTLCLILIEIVKRIDKINPFAEII